MIIVAGLIGTIVGCSVGLLITPLLRRFLEHFWPV